MGWTRPSKITYRTQGEWSFIELLPIFCIMINEMPSCPHTKQELSKHTCKPVDEDTHRSGFAWTFCGTHAKMFCSLPAVWRNGSSSTCSSESWPAPRHSAGTADPHLPPNLQERQGWGEVIHKPCRIRWPIMSDALARGIMTLLLGEDTC